MIISRPAAVRPDPSQNKKPLTAKQEAIHDYIRQHVYQLGFPPSVREIGEQFAILSPNGVMSHLKALERKGVITRLARRSRGITVAAPKSTASLPYLGKVS